MGRKDVTPVIRESRHTNKGRNCIYVLVARQGKGEHMLNLKGVMEQQKTTEGLPDESPHLLSDPGATSGAKSFTDTLSWNLNSHRVRY